MAVNYNPTDPVAGASRATKEVELWTDLGDTLPDINTRITATEAHLADASDAHDASAVSIVDAGAYFTGADVEAALQELGAAGGGSGGTIRVEDEGVSTVAAATAINFAGAGVTVTNAGADEALVTISGSAGGSATAYTPTLVNGTLGNGTIAGHYVDTGKLRLVRVQLTFGSTTSLTGSTLTGFSLPTGAGSYASPITGGVGQIMGRDISAGAWRAGVCWVTNANLEAFTFEETTVPMNYANPWTWASGDTLEATGMAVLA